MRPGRFHPEASFNPPDHPGLDVTVLLGVARDGTLGADVAGEATRIPGPSLNLGAGAY